VLYVNNYADGRIMCQHWANICFCFHQLLTTRFVVMLCLSSGTTTGPLSYYYSKALFKSDAVPHRGVGVFQA